MGAEMKLTGHLPQALSEIWTHLLEQRLSPTSEPRVGLLSSTVHL